MAIHNTKIIDVFERVKCEHDWLTMEATVDTGFEKVAAGELLEKFDWLEEAHYVCSPGRIFFNAKWENYTAVSQLRSVDNLAIVVLSEMFEFPYQKDLALDYFVDLANRIEFDKTLEMWATVMNFNGELHPNLNRDSSKKRLNFRVTARRSYIHPFASMEAASKFGGILNDRFGWRVDMTDFDLEILLYIVQDRVTVALKTTEQSLHHRSILKFGPTTLRATVCYNLLRLANIKPGDVVVDPLCGSGSIPIECGLTAKETVILCGDIDEKAVDRTDINIANNNLSCKLIPHQWDATKLPFRSAIIDVIVTDMPFGKRSGNKFDNRVLYKELMLEFARISRCESGRVVLLTNDRCSLLKALRNPENPYWNVVKILLVKLGGLKPAVFVLKRSSLPYRDPNSEN